MDHGTFQASQDAFDTSDEIVGDVGAARAETWLDGRVARLCHDAGCGFLKTASGALVYFSFSDVAGAESLRPSARVRYQPAGAGIPKALRVATI